MKAPAGSGSNRRFPVRFLMGLVRGYQRFISPWTPQRCRFYPTCSQYAIDAICWHGSLKGSWLAVIRILKCQPLHPGGWDPVPGTPEAAGPDPTEPEPDCRHGSRKEHPDD